MNRQNLTVIQRKSLEFIRSFHKENGFSPTRVEICGKFGWKSHNSAQSVIKALVRKGYLRYNEKFTQRNLMVI